MTRKEALDDLEFIRTLAEEGRAAPLLGGAHMAAFGALTAAALAMHFALFNLLQAPQWVWASWIAYGVLCTLAGWLLQRRIAKKPGVTAVSNRVESAVWGGVSVAMSAISFGCIGRLLLEGDPTAPNMIPGAAFALYGTAQITIAAVTRQPVLRASGWLAAAVGLVALVFANAPWMYLLTAAGVLLVLVGPGLMLMREEPKDIV